MNFRAPCKACLLLVLIAAFFAKQALARKWTDSTGTFSVEADYVELVGGDVALKQPDGRLIRLPLERLSEADQQHVRSLAVPVTLPRVDEAGTVRSELSPSDSPKLISDAETQVVIAEGVGTNAEDALREAFRQAVRQVVGTFVDAETLVNNDELVSDKILTYSNGYITAYKTLRETERNGLARVTIQAAVKREPLVAKLSAVINVRVAPFRGSDLAAQAVSKTEVEKDARALLRPALVGFPHNLIEASSEGEPKIEERSEESVTISYEVKVAVNIDKYTPFQQRLTQVLERIAKYKGQSTVMRKPTVGVPLAPWSVSGEWEAPGCFSGPIWPSFTEVWKTPFDAKSDFVFAVNTSRTQLHDKTTWKWYCVPRAAVASPNDFAQLREHAVQSRRVAFPAEGRIQVEFLDGKGIAIAAEEILMTDNVPGSYIVSPIVEQWTWVVSPYIMMYSGDTIYARSVSIPCRLELPLKSLAEIESVRCTVTGP